MNSPVERVPIEEVADLIQVGQPLPFRVLDALERLLLNEGQVIASDRQMEMLVERGAWVDRKLVEERRRSLGLVPGMAMPDVQRAASLFDRWERALWDLDAVLRRTAKGMPWLCGRDPRMRKRLEAPHMSWRGGTTLEG